MVLGKRCFVITPRTAIFNAGQVNSLSPKLFNLACCAGFSEDIWEIWRRFHISNLTSKVNLFISNDTQPAQQRLRALPL